MVFFTFRKRLVIRSGSSKIPLFGWKDKTRDFIVTTDLNDDGTVKKDKEGIEKRSFSCSQAENDWVLLKKKTESDIEKSHKTVGAYVYDTLLQNPYAKSSVESLYGQSNVSSTR